MISIPLFSSQNWEVLNYRNLKPNRVEFTKQGLKISVDRSASPVIYKLPKTENIYEIFVEGRVLSGQLLLAQPALQGIQKNDDFVARIGLVAAGTKKLNWAQKLAAPAWIKRLHQIAPVNTGIDAIYFYEVAQDQSLLGRKRTHPLSDLIKEDIVAVMKADGTFQFTKTLDQPLSVLALWISSDGDDSQSTFDVLISQVELRQRPSAP